MRKRKWIAGMGMCAIALGVASTAQAQRYYFQGPYGPGGTWNLYELRGANDITANPDSYVGRYQVQAGGATTLNTGPGLTWWDAQNAAAATTENVTGTNKPAHLAAFSGATASLENNFVHGMARYGDVFIGLSDDENIGVAGAAETGTGNPAADAVRGLNNAEPGWRWTSGETFDYSHFGGGEPNNCCAGGEDAAHLRGDGLWNDNGDGLDGESAPAFKYVYEYETHSATPLNLPATTLKLNPTPAKTPGGEGGLGFMSIREVHSSGTVSGNQGALDLLYGNLPKDAEVNYEAPVLNKNGLSGGAGGGNFNGDTDFGLVTEGALPPGDINSFAIRAHGYVRVPAGQGGQYTFAVNTDDSGELWIYDKSFDSVTNGNITPYGSIAFLGDRGADNTLGVITLEGNKDYEFEYVMNENGGGASAELSAAHGARSSFDVNFKLVGGDPNPTGYPGGTTPKINAPFQIKEVLRVPEGSGNLNTLADAKNLLNNPDADDLVFTGESNTVNRTDQTTNGLNSGRFPNDDNFLNDTFNNPPDFDDNDFVFNAKATIVVQTAGEYTFGFDSDDGAQLIVDGASFTSAFGPAVASGTSLTADILTGSSLSGGSTFLTAGTHNIEFTMWERGGGSFAELFVAPGRVTGFGTDLFSLLSDTSVTIPSQEIAGALQLGDGTLTGEVTGQEGDTDNDGDVDLDDLNAVRNNFGGSGSVGGTAGDAFPYDGVVDLDDLNAVRNNFGVTGGANSVPEPSSFALIGLGLAGLFGVRRFRRK